MTIINLRDFYYWYTQDEYIEVSDDVAEALRASVRSEAAYTERARYNKAYYSLDAHFILGMTYREIAQAEGVDKSSVRESVLGGLKSMKKYLQKNS